MKGYLSSSQWAVGVRLTKKKKWLASKCQTYVEAFQEQQKGPF